MAAEWYYTQNNQQQGPVTLEALQAMAANGQIQRGDLVWRQGMANWQPAGDVPGVFGGAPAGGAPAGPTGGAPAWQGPAMGGGQPAPIGYGQPGAHVPNYLVQSILVTLLCCLPVGIVAIIYAAQVNGKLAAGNYAGAVEASNKAKTWSWVSFGLGLVGTVIWVIINVLAAGGGRYQ